MINKPTVQLSGTNGNTLALLARCTQALKRNKQYDQADELRDKVFEAESYSDALRIMMIYVDAQ